MNPKPKVAILMFSLTAREARVMRQVLALKEDYAVTVLGFGANPFTDSPQVQFVELQPYNRSLPAKLLRRGLLYATALGALIPAADVWRQQARTCWRQARAWLLRNPVDVLIAHEPESAVLASQIKKRTGARIILDLHE